MKSSVAGDCEVYGCSPTSVFLVNAEVVSMEGSVEGGVGNADKTSPRRIEIEKSRSELRHKCEIRDKTKRELEFLLEGGNPLELESRNAASVSVQSTSFTEQYAYQLVISEAKGSFAFTASPHGDSVESNGGLGTNPCEPNSADNLMLFDAECELSEGNRRSSHPSRSNIVSSGKPFHTGGYHRIGVHGDSAVFDIPRKAYKRRYRSHTYHDGTLSSSTDVNPTHGTRGPSLRSCHDPKDAKGLISDVENSIILSNSKPTSPVDDTLHKTRLMGSQQYNVLDGIQAAEPTKDLIEDCPLNNASDAIACEIAFRDQHNQKCFSEELRMPIQMDSNGPEIIPAIEGMVFAGTECQPGVSANKNENKSSTLKRNGFSSRKSEATKNDTHNGASCGMKGLDSESSCIQTSRSIDRANDVDTTKMRNTASNGQIKNQNSVPEKIKSGIASCTPGTVESTSAHQAELEDGVELRPEEELNGNGSTLKKEVKDQTVNEEIKTCNLTEPDSRRKPVDPSVAQVCLINESSYSLRCHDSTDISIPGLPQGASSMLVSGPKMTRVTDEDSVLKEAKIIEAKRKRIAELSVANSPKKIRFISHWDYVLEEMAWLANDFIQERNWKIAVATQISSRAAFTCHVRKQKKRFYLEIKQVAHSLAKSVMEFWQFAEEKTKLLDQQGQGVDGHSVLAYAMRFQKHKKTNVVYIPAVVPVPLTPDGISDMGSFDPSLKDILIEDNLFYTVLPGTMESYRNSVESHVAQFQRIASGVLEEVETSAWGVGADNADDGKGTNTYDMSLAFEDSKISGFTQKKQKHWIYAYGDRPYEVSSDISHMLAAENKVAHQSSLLVKRPGGNIDVSNPTKRVRTASRKAASPFSVGTSRFLQANKTDASSGDTNSYQDDLSTLQGGSHAPYNVEVESVVKFDKQLGIGSAEGLMKHKNKKATHLFQREHLRKSHQHESNCSSGLLGQPMAKKQKTMRQSQDNTFDNITPIGGSVPSPVVSQMSNMSNPNKFIKMLGRQDRGRTQKLLKMSSGQPGSGSPWTLFEDQALVVLAHDLGPNWELISDAINSTFFQFKCVFRKAKECKGRHNFLMDRTSGDGADSAEDSISSQAYPSTLPGIPKGSARQLFQRLQGPIEEDALKSHFEKIIIVGQKRHNRKTQDPKLLHQPHSSHTIALSQVCPNNLNGGPVLTPLDLCESTIAGNDMLSLGYQGPHSGGLSISNHGTVTSLHSASGPTSSLHGSSSMIVGSNFSSSPSSLNSSVRPPRSVTLPIDEQQRMQQYNQMMPGRGPSTSASGALLGAEPGGRMLPGGSGMGLVSGINRGMPMVRPGFQGIVSQPVATSASMVSPVMLSSNVHSGVVSSQGSSTLRPCGPLHMRPGLGKKDSQRPMMPTDLQIPGNSHHLGGLSSSPSPNQKTISSPVSAYPLHHHSSPQQPQVLSPQFLGPASSHTPSPQQQAYALRLAKERQQQNRFLQHSQFNTSNSLVPHNIHPQPQIPLQNNPQIQPQMGSSPVSHSPMNSIAPQGATRNVPAGCTNQTSKQRQRQQQNQLPQSNRPHPQQRQQTQPQQLTNDKGAERGNQVAHPIDRALVNGVSTNPQKHSPGQGVQLAKIFASKSNLGHVSVAQQTLSHRLNKLQTRGPSSDQHLIMSSSAEMDTGSSSAAAKWQASDLLLDQTTLNSTKNMSSMTSVLLKATQNSHLHSQSQGDVRQSGKANMGGGPSDCSRLE